MDKFKQQCACGREFKQKKNLYAHMRKQHLKEPLETKPKNYECDFCGRKFFCQSSIIRHLRRNHSDTNNKLIGINKKWNLVCPYGKCSKNFRTYEILREHLAEKHDFQIEFEELTFSSVRDFDQWKDSMQLRTLSLYTQCTAARTLRIELGHRLYFNCHRSNVYKHRGNNIRALKSQGSNKIGKACPSRLEVTYTEYAGQIIIKVKFWKTHCGHTNQVERLPLDRQVKCLIAEKLEKGYTFEQIVEWIQASREQDNVTIKRLQLINRKDIHNIIRDLKVKTPKKKRTTTRNEDVKVDKNNISETECDSGNSMLSTFNTKDNIPSSSNGENNIKFDINDSESNVLNINSSESNIQTINNSVDDIFAINISKEYLTTASGSKNNNNIFTISNSKTSISATVGNNNISPKTKSKKDVNSKNNIHKINENLVHKAELFSNIAQVVSLNDQDFLHMKEQIDRLIKRTKLSYSHTKNIVPDLETNKDTTICSNSEHKRNVNEILMNKTELLSKIVKTVSFGVKDAREIEKQIDKLIERAKIQNLDCEKLLQKETQNRVLENT